MSARLGSTIGVLALMLVGGAAAAAAARSRVNDPAVVVSMPAKKVWVTDTVTFTARIRPDLAATMRPVVYQDEMSQFTPHIIGWLWIPDLDGIDPWTKACITPALSCTMMVHGSGTMVFTIRTRDQLCADWVHVEAHMVPGIDERNDSMPRIRADSITMAIRTKQPHWERCTA
jgi:hypothetical protein